MDGKLSFMGSFVINNFFHRRDELDETFLAINDTWFSDTLKWVVVEINFTNHVFNI